MSIYIALIKLVVFHSWTTGSLTTQDRNRSNDFKIVCQSCLYIATKKKGTITIREPIHDFPALKSSLATYMTKQLCVSTDQPLIDFPLKFQSSCYWKQTMAWILTKMQKNGVLYVQKSLFLRKNKLLINPRISLLNTMGILHHQFQS